MTTQELLQSIAALADAVKRDAEQGCDAETIRLAADALQARAKEYEIRCKLQQQ